MEKLKLHSPDLSRANIDKVAELFPQCVSEARDENGAIVRQIDFDLLRQELSGSIVEGPAERYQLTWPGKREALLTANAPIAKTLRPCREESVDFDATRNLFIEGDNLDALKLLQETYLGKVKMIYIDPPYNTGNDFIYEDDFTSEKREHDLASAVRDKEGNQIFDAEKWRQNTVANGRFHSDWLSMIYPRLRLARNLLRDDGVIFISIDDGEVHNLRKLCDEVFGEESFVSQVVWQRSKKGDSKLIAKVHEYILCYVRNKEAVLASGTWRRPKQGADQVLEKYAYLMDSLSRDHDNIRAEMQAWYKQLANDDPRKAHKHYNWSDDRGLYFASDFAGPDDGRESRPRHDILHPVTGKSCKKPSTGWRWDEEKTNWALAQNPPRIHFGPDETTIPNRKSYLFEIDSEPYSSVFYRDGRSATLEVEELVGKGWFPFPKNTDVLAELIELVTKPDDTVLDFFAGSGSTAHAVMKVNQTHSSKRRFVLVQIPEETGRTKYGTIAELTKERLRRAGAQIKENLANRHCEEATSRRSNPEQAALPGSGDWIASPSARNDGKDASSLDIGFRVLKVDSSNMRDVFYLPDNAQQATLLDTIDNIKPDRTPEDLLFHVLLDWGVPLDLPIFVETIEGKTVYFVHKDRPDLVACFERGVTEELVKAIAARAPQRAVFRDAGFASDSVKINVEQIFKLLSPATEVKVI